MFRLFALVLLIFPLMVRAGPCTITDKDLVGGWERSGGAGFFEQMEFTVEDGAKVFNSWLHDRPEISDGVWSLEGCALDISDPHSAMPPFAYVVHLQRKNVLELRERDGSVAKYRRIKSVR